MKKSILKVLFKPLWIVNNLIKKDKKLIFFYSNLGFRDNVKAFYDYLIKHGYNEKYKIVVSINDFNQYGDKAPKNVLFVGNKQGIKYFLKAKYAFYCFGKYPIKPAKSQMVVNLWHGTPLKKIGNLEKGLENIDYNFFTKVITSADMYKPIMAKIFGCKEEQVEVFGNPRNDEMFVADNIADGEIKKKTKLIVWLPTYREYDDDFVISALNEEEIERLDLVLENNDCQLIIKLHPLQQGSIAQKNYKCIEFITQDELNRKEWTVYTLLRNADALITDYSSVYFDYMLLDRPIAFAIEDIVAYKEKRGFIFDNPKEYMPGVEICNFEDVKNFVEDVVAGKDDYVIERNKVNNKVNHYKDGECSKRIAERFLVDE